MLCHPFILQESQVSLELQPNLDSQEFMRRSSEKSNCISTTHKTNEKESESEKNLRLTIEPKDIKIEGRLEDLSSIKSKVGG